MISPQLLLTLRPKLDPKAAAAAAPSLQAAIDKFSINTKPRLAHFLAQVAHESGFLPIEENLRYSAQRLCQVWPKLFTPQVAAQCEGNPEKIANLAYGNRLGNTQPGDGYKYRGRGLIQLTGRDNYAKYAKLLGQDIVNNPDLLLTHEVSALAAAAFWSDRGLNKLADQGGREMVAAITKLVNGGTHGLDERTAYFLKAQTALG
ncbi:MAG TPA: glycoside hydrolase family 19 protein [Myxococcaceae bacterium]|nr:glycoside hydrolase family 19 protein [Myxococcaceae bacterium]